MKLSKKNSMKFLNRFQFLFKNIYILYTLFIVSVIYVFMLISFHNINAVAFFLILGLVLYCYTKNMSIILSVCLILTMIIFPIKVTKKKRKEGLENSTSTDTSTSTTTTPSTTSTTTSSTTTPSTTTPSTTTSDDVATSSSTSTGGTSSSKKEPTGTSSVTPTDSFTGSLAGQSRIDPAATMTQAFNNLENMLGGEGISKLSNDTQTLVANQAKLFKTIENMTPLIEKASTLMNKFSKF